MHYRVIVGADRYRGHVDGLYLRGSSWHAGGSITVLLGYNAAQVVLDDLGVEVDWTLPPIAAPIAKLLKST